MKKGCKYPIIVDGKRETYWTCLEEIRPNAVWVVQDQDKELYPEFGIPTFSTFRPIVYKVKRGTCVRANDNVFQFGEKHTWDFHFVREARQGALKLLAIVKKNPQARQKIPLDLWKVIARHVKDSTDDWRWLK